MLHRILSKRAQPPTHFSPKSIIKHRRTLPKGMHDYAVTGYQTPECRGM
jgi:hypothetical protein